MTTLPQCVAIAGASGFVGTHLCQRLADDGHQVVALSRYGRAPIDHPNVEGKRCDLFSMLDIERALQGVNQAVYLVHSMLPSARLEQASFQDMDAVLADNFARACEVTGTQHIVYLGGLIPHGKDISQHLESRREVEEILGSRGAEVTVLRAGLVMGPHGSSFRIVTRLARRLPVMVCPSWTMTPTQPIALSDVVELITRTLTTPHVQGDVYDIGAPEVMTYREILERTAELERGQTPHVRSVPLLTPRLSALWVSLVTQTPMPLVKPLVRSLEHPMVARDRRLQELLDVPGLSFDAAAQHALEVERQNPAPPKRKKKNVRKPSAPTVRSIQRLPRPAGANTQWVAGEYLRWLSREMRPRVIRVDVEGLVARFVFRPTSTLLLELALSPERSTPDRTLLYITGGRLARVREGSRGRLEFRSLETCDCVLAAVHDFEPSLPWPIYRYTQAVAHLWVMKRFRRHLAKITRNPSNTTIQPAPPQRASAQG